MRSSNLQQLSLICLISATIPITSALALATAVSAAQVVGLIPRAETCGGNSNLKQCGSSFPSDFCCPIDLQCLPINNTIAISAICCPAGSDCSFIQPITCDVGQLDASKHPGNQIHSANATDLKLETCGGSCCPLGYTCQGNMCALSSNPSAITSSSISPTASATSTGTAASQTTASGPAIPTTASSSSDFPAKAVVAGFFPGMLLGALLAVAVIWIIKKRREAAAKERYSGDFGHVSRTVSDPIYDPVYAARTDFLRRGSASASAASQPSPARDTQMQMGAVGMSLANHNISMTSSDTTRGKLNVFPSPQSAQPQNTPRVRALFSKSPKIGLASFKRDPYTTPTRTPTHRSSRSSKRRAGPERSGSTETIDVLMPAPSFLGAPNPNMGENGRPLTGGTTFTRLMEDAGFGRDSRDMAGLGVRGVSPRRGV